jgi:hypothetical protein
MGFEGVCKLLRVSRTLHPQEIAMLWTIFVILVVLWLLGFSLHIGGGLIHILIVVAVIVLIINLVSGRRAL